MQVICNQNLNLDPRRDCAHPDVHYGRGSLACVVRSVQPLPRLAQQLNLRCVHAAVAEELKVDSHDTSTIRNLA
jgi:hypothetical protein